MKSNQEKKIKEEEGNNLRIDITKMKWTNTKLTQKVKTLEEQKNVLVKQFDIQKVDLSSAEKELADCRDETENMKRELNEFIRSRDLMNKAYFVFFKYHLNIF
ncbi:hypothetical protein HELRODRAFT_169118 [Helobdella robusta]|uniref:Uncharacterized protein n=1 Tax=Helobdella robusta TaxID=6412 RepID=T1F1F4_HELRO|nr:hypothetical protein HELRODRAFT_169118 [Helobdella robusta]ESO08313.1 hypothetical protein HELRODRAFT_169118 [Helobdella robusta]